MQPNLPEKKTQAHYLLSLLRERRRVLVRFRSLDLERFLLLCVDFLERSRDLERRLRSRLAPLRDRDRSGLRDLLLYDLVQ